MPDPGTAPERSARIAAFLAAAQWGQAKREPLAGDASNRRYLRLRHRDGSRAVLMDAAPERGEDIRPFIAVARHLSGLGLSPPALFAADATHGLLLMEDLGDDLFARLLDTDPGCEATLYGAATDLLVELHRHPAPPGLPHYDAATMGESAALALDWYLPAATGSPAAPALRREFADRVATLCAELAPVGPSPALRDFHAENLIWLPERAGNARVGLLDFQDAMHAHPGYDLASLLTDARRDVPGSLRAAMTRRYIDATGAQPEAFTTALACLAAQRNLRILGVFCRLGLRDGKQGYLRHLPRVWRYLSRDLEHPALAGLAARIRGLMPAPSPDIIERIAARCPTNPTP